MKKEKLMKWLMYLAGIVCLYTFIAIRSLPLFNSVLKEKMEPGYWDKTKYGELYYFSMIPRFREKGLPPVKEKYQFSKDQTSLEEAEILVFGDSFFDIARGTQFPEIIKEETRKKVHYVYQESPLEYFARLNYKNNIPKILIYGRVERFIPSEFEKPHETIYIGDERSQIRKFFAGIKDKIFYGRTEELYDAMLKRSYFTTGIYSLIAAVKFDLFDYISNLTPVYSVKYETPWLFYYDQVNDENTSFYYKHSQEEIENYCNNIKDLDIKLLKDYNIKLIFLPIPAKYTLYHKFVNNDQYNNFLPRLYEELEKKHIKFIRIYEDYLNSEEVLYYGTDSHWKKKGMDMAADKIIKFLKNDSTLNYYIN
jgi:hypothetical protein